ncbi:MAG TPA: ATP-binding protein [Mycobacteriales bacterium]|nr:ATP-binding protein [Mycobacteriales bacterium]
MTAFLRRHWTVRVRLTALFGGLFFLAGTVLLVATWLLLRHQLGASLGHGDEPVHVLVVPATGSGAPPGEPTRGAAAGSDPSGITPEQLVALRSSLQAQALRSLAGRGALALAGVGLGAVWLGWLFAGRVLRPVKRITATARRVADRSLHERIGLGGPPDELRELADTVDSMLERLDRSFDGQRAFVANASHELRTPLTINRTLLEVALSRPDTSADLRQLGGTLLEVNARHERLIDGLLLLARSDREITDREPVDLAELAAHVVEQVRGTAARTGVAVTTSLRPAPTAGDPLLLERLVFNLVDNALRYNIPGGTVQLTVHSGTESAALAVVNTGPAVSRYEIPGLFQPFRRLAGRVGSTGGTGLGLSIVRAVARAHGGEARAEPGPDGGLRVTVSLPASARGAAGAGPDLLVGEPGRHLPQRRH